MFERENNPYTLQFSFIPPQYISRKTLSDEIVGDLRRKTPAFRCHFLTGVRGSGKTVMMAEIINHMKSLSDWVVVDIENPEEDIVDSLARGLYRQPGIKNMFVNANDTLDMMLGILRKEGKSLLIAIDEATYCKEIAAFSHALSAYARAGYNVYVIMTGLKENIKAIKNDPSLTFLYRAKEHTLDPLNITAIIAEYGKTFGINQHEAQNMAWMTKGYSFAFQALGYLYWEALCAQSFDEIDANQIQTEYDQYLAEFVYDKIWSELPRVEKEILYAMAECGSENVKDVRAQVQMNSSMFSVYRGRLIDRGLINGREYGKVKLVLPRFKEYIEVQAAMQHY